MIDRIAADKKRRYNELHNLLADPDIIANTGEYQKLAKELAGLTQLVNEYTAYQKLAKDVRDLDHVIRDKSADKEFLVLVEEEKHTIEQALKESALRLEEMVLEKESGGDKDIIMEIRAGTGGLEAALFAGDLLRMYSKYAAKMGWKVELIDASASEKGGYKEVILSMAGSGVYGRMKFESGTHRVQRVPETEASGRIHTSAATVAVLPDAGEVDLDIAPEDIRIDVYRAGGKGGQGVNRTDSAVRLTHVPTGIVVTCQDERSQLKNKAKAMRVLRARLFDAREKERTARITAERRSQVGSGDRSEKIRTYNFPDRRITDHRIGFTAHNLEGVLEGELDQMISALREEERQLRLKAASS